MALTQQQILDLAAEQKVSGNFSANQLAGVAKTGEIDAVNVPMLSSESGAEAIKSDVAKLNDMANGGAVTIDGAQYFKQPDGSMRAIGGNLAPAGGVNTKPGTTDKFGNVVNSYGTGVTGQAATNPNAGDNSFTADQLTEMGITDPVAEGLSYNPSTGTYYVANNADSNAQALLDLSRGVTSSNSNLQTESSWADAEFKKLYNGIDPMLADQLASIQADYQARKTQLEQINNSLTQRMAASGYRYGTAQYVSQLNSQLISTEERAGIQKLSELAAETQSLMMQAKMAAQTKKFDMLNKYMDKIETSRQNQVKEAEKLAATKAAEDKAIQDRLQKIKDDEAKVQAEIEKDRADILKDLGKNRAPKEVIDAVNAAKDVAEMVNASGDYLQSGSGVLGEYFNYKQEALAAGQQPLDWISYKNWDDNNKKSIAAAGVPVGIYTPAQEKVITRVNDSISKNSVYTKTTNMRAFIDNVKNALSQRTGVGDIAAINQFQKVIDEGAVTRDQDVVLIQKSQSLADSLKLKLSRLAKGEQLSETQRSEMKTLVDDLYESQIAALKKDPFIAAKQKELERSGVSIEDTLVGGIAELEASPGQALIEDENNAKNLVISYGETNPAVRKQILDLVSQVDPTLGRPLTYSEVQQVLGIK